ncbi:DUF4468 domain-containing protein [Flavobacterium sp. '19STA2R22 D10 B1']|uniref:DUF4468 domain-containing protein n=1 Tax=Flavobacterium aerium TaxID=3037261 RepID=UPI00278C1E17|nr:DUF4468 domain-containing protein [Flavobacterium sp. '19STA2R22 D10 B1']
MKSIILLFLVSLSTYGQIIEDIPIDDQKGVHFNTNLQVEGKTKEELYTIAKEFITVPFKSSIVSIQTEDKEQGLIIAKASSFIEISSGILYAERFRMDYIFKIQCRDNVLQYEIYDITYLGRSGFRNAETIFEKSYYYRENGKPKSIPEKFKLQTQKKVTSIQDLLIASIKSPVVPTENSKKQ